MPHEDWLAWEEATRKQRIQRKRVQTSKARYGDDVFKRGGKKGVLSRWGLMRKVPPTQKGVEA